MTKDMPSSSPNTSLMKGTRGTSWKLTRMGSPVRSSPRRSAMPSANVRWMTTPGARVVRGPVRASSDGEEASSRPVAVAGAGLGGRSGSGNGSTSTVEHPLARHATSRAGTRRWQREFIRGTNVNCFPGRPSRAEAGMQRKSAVQTRLRCDAAQEVGLPGAGRLRRHRQIEREPGEELPIVQFLRGHFSEFRRGVVRCVAYASHAARPIRADTATGPVPTGLSPSPPQAPHTPPVSSGCNRLRPSRPRCCAPRSRRGRGAPRTPSSACSRGRTDRTPASCARTTAPCSRVGGVARRTPRPSPNGSARASHARCAPALRASSWRFVPSPRHSGL